VQSILDLISKATGMKGSMFFGGPEPAHGGRLQLIRHVVRSIDLSVHANIVLQCPFRQNDRQRKDELREIRAPAI